MGKISNSDDSYRRFVVDNKRDNWLLAYIAFAILEEQRIEWMEHAEKYNDGTPSTDEIKKWYEKQTTKDLELIEGIAFGALGTYAEEIEELLQKDYSVEREKVVKDVIVEEVKRGQRFWPQLGINVLGGVAAAVIFAAILVVLILTVKLDPSLQKVITDVISQQTKENTNGETTRQ